MTALDEGGWGRKIKSLKAKGKVLRSNSSIRFSSFPLLQRAVLGRCHLSGYDETQKSMSRFGAR